MSDTATPEVDEDSPLIISAMTSGEFGSDDPPPSQDDALMAVLPTAPETPDDRSPRGNPGHSPPATARETTHILNFAVPAFASTTRAHHFISPNAATTWLMATAQSQYIAIGMVPRQNSFRYGVTVRLTNVARQIIQDTVGCLIRAEEGGEYPSQVLKIVRFPRADMTVFERELVQRLQSEELGYCLDFVSFVNHFFNHGGQHLFDNLALANRLDIDLHPRPGLFWVNFLIATFNLTCDEYANLQAMLNE